MCCLGFYLLYSMFFVFKQKTAYEMRISDWSSDVCSSDLGYFFAKLGRDKVVVLIKDEVELPSDVMGIVYERMDANEGWKLKLARELKSAGFDVDLNNAV